MSIITIVRSRCRILTVLRSRCRILKVVRRRCRILTVVRSRCRILTVVRSRCRDPCFKKQVQDYDSLDEPLTLISYLCQVPDVCEGGGTEGLHQVTAPQITSRDPS